MGGGRALRPCCMPCAARALRAPAGCAAARPRRDSAVTCVRATCQTRRPTPSQRSPTVQCVFSIPNAEFRILRASAPAQLVQIQSGARDGTAQIGDPSMATVIGEPGGMCARSARLRLGARPATCSFKRAGGGALTAPRARPARTHRCRRLAEQLRERRAWGGQGLVATGCSQRTPERDHVCDSAMNRNQCSASTCTPLTAHTCAPNRRAALPHYLPELQHRHLLCVGGRRVQGHLRRPRKDPGSSQRGRQHHHCLVRARRSHASRLAASSRKRGTAPLHAPAAQRLYAAGRARPRPTSGRGRKSLSAATRGSTASTPPS